MRIEYEIVESIHCPTYMFAYYKERLTVDLLLSTKNIFSDAAAKRDDSQAFIFSLPNYSAAFDTISKVYICNI